MIATSGIILWWLAIISLAIILDWLIVRIWRQYRQLKRVKEDAGERMTRGAILKTALSHTWHDILRTFSSDQFTGILGKLSVQKEPPVLTWVRTYLFKWPLIQLVLALGVMYAGQFLMIHIPRAQGWGLSVLIGGLVLIVFRQKMEAPEKFHWTDGLQMSLGVLICLPLALDTKQWTTVAAPWSQIGLWLGAIILVSTPALKLEAVPLNLGWPQISSWLRWEKFLLVGLVVGAFLLRVIAVRNIPGPIDPDEASLGLFLIDVAEGRYRFPFGIGWATHPALQYFFAAPLVLFIQHPLTLMRIPSVFLGSFAVGTFYLAARTGWGRRVGVGAAFLLVCSDVSIHFSRLGVNNISDSLFATWTIAALWLAASTGHPLAYVFTGVGVGLGQYYYFGNRALPFVVLGTLAVWSLFNWQKFWRAWRLLLYMLLVTVVVAGPILGLMIRDPSYTLERVERVATIFTNKFSHEAEKTGESVSSLRWQQIKDSFSVFTIVSDRGSFYNSGRAMLSSALALLFYIGILVLFLRWRQPASLGTLVWILVFIVLGSMMINTAATFQRLLGMYPAVLLVVVIGLEAGAEVLARQISVPKLTPNLVMSVVVFLAALSSLYFYFDVFQYQIVWKVSDQEAAAIVAREYEDFNGAGTFVLNTRLGVGDDGMVYLPVMKIVAGTDILGDVSQIDLDTAERPIRIYFFYDKFDELPAIRDQFPGGVEKYHARYADGEIILIRYTIP